MKIKEMLIQIERDMHDIIHEFLLFEAINKKKFFSSNNKAQWIIISNALQNSYSLKLSNLVNIRIDEEQNKKCFSISELIDKMNNANMENSIIELFNDLIPKIKKLINYRNTKIAHKNIIYYNKPIGLKYNDIYRIMHKVFRALQILDNHINKSNRIEDFDYYIKGISTNVNIWEKTYFKNFPQGPSSLL